MKSRRSSWAMAALVFPLSLTVVQSSAAADTIAFDSIPTSKIPPFHTRDGGPDHIPATEKVAGFYPAVTPPAEVKRLEERGGGELYTVVFSTEEQAKSFAANGGYPADEGSRSGVCLSTGWSGASRVQFGTYIPPKYKPGSPEALAKAKNQQLAKARALAEERAQAVRLGALGRLAVKHARTATPAKDSPVVAIRSAHFVSGSDGNATYDVVDVWFDRETLGVRLKSRTSVPFRRLATGMGGLGIYATRDGSTVNFFVTPPTTPELDGVSTRFLQSLGNRLVAQMPEGSMSSSECGFLSVSLQAQAGSGQMASILATEFLPPQPDEDGGPAEGNPGNDNNDAMDSVTSAVRAVRTRPLLANLSISQLATESTPVVSVTFGWAGPDQQQRF